MHGSALAVTNIKPGNLLVRLAEDNLTFMHWLVLDLSSSTKAAGKVLLCTDRHALQYLHNASMKTQ